MILIPYFLSSSITEAMTTEEQSVSGMKPIFTSFFSGASEPAAHAPTRTASGTMLAKPAAPAFFRKSLLSKLIHVLPKQIKKALTLASFRIGRTPLFMFGRVVAPGSPHTLQALCHRRLID